MEIMGLQLIAHWEHSYETAILKYFPPPNLFSMSHSSHNAPMWPAVHDKCPGIHPPKQWRDCFRQNSI